MLNHEEQISKHLNENKKKSQNTKKLRHTFPIGKSLRTFICHCDNVTNRVVDETKNKKQLKTRAQFTTNSTEREESNNHASNELLQSTADLTLISAGLRIDWTKLTVTEATELFSRGGDGTTRELAVSG